jgi:hypothetical protein
MGRAMTRAHRWELLNDHMRDVNHKKMVGMGLFIVPILSPTG